MPKKAAAAKGKPARKEGSMVTTTSTFSPRLKALKADLDREIRARFPQAEAMFEYNMHGWRVSRPKRIETWKGTIDPNFLHVYLAERKNGITLHIWNPYDPYGLSKRAKALQAAGFKVMRACVVYNRKGEYPIGAVTPVFDAVRKRMDEEA
jgi:hypothetical protein